MCWLNRKSANYTLRTGTNREHKCDTNTKQEKWNSKGTPKITMD
jgi:hypothetical protein